MKKSLYVFKTLFLAVLISTSFSLMAQAPEIELQQPTGGEHWTGGGTYLISWLDNFNGNVDVLYRQNYGSGWSSNHLENGILTYPETDDLLANIQSELGENYTIADWEDLKTIPLADLDQWITDMGWDIPVPTSYWILNNGVDLDPANPGFHYLVKYYDDNGNPPSWAYTESIGGKIWLGSFAGISRPVLAKKIATEYAAISPVNGLSGATCYWNTHGLGLGTYQIKVRSHSQPDLAQYADESGTFQLVNQEEGEITIFRPDGTEDFPLGTTQKISWVDNLNEPVKIEYTKDGGANWVTIKESASGSTYNWPVRSPLEAGTYNIRISSTVSGATTAPAVSPNFSVVASSGTFIEVLQPTVADIIWKKGTKHLISWNDDLGEKVNIYLKKGAVVDFDHPLKVNASGSTWVWNIPSTATIGDDYRIYIKSVVSDLHGESEFTFAISSSTGTFVEVLQPTEVDIKWALGTSHLISWNDDFSEKVNIYLYKGGSQLGSALKTNASGSTWVWHIPSTGLTPDTDYSIYIESVSNSDLHGESLNDFAISASSGSFIEVIQPSIDGIEWERGTAHLISWNDDLSEKVNIYLYKNGVQLGAALKENASGSTWTWNIDDGLDADDDYQIYVASVVDPTNLHAISEFEFDIIASSGTYIDLIQPNGGEEWTAGLSYYISWDDDFLEGVNIYLYKAGGQVGDALVENTIGSTWVWNIPLSTPQDDDYQIYIESVNDPTNVHGISDGNFTILPFVMMSAYPNPTSTQFTLEIDDPNGQMYQVTLRDRFSNEVYNSNVDAGAINSVNISTQDLPNGVYFLNINSDTYNTSKKIIVNHR